MAGSAASIPELEAIIQSRSPVRLAQAVERITDLFLNGARRFNEDHVRLFDDVLGCLVEEIECKARAELARRLAPVSNAPVQVIRRLARDDEIAVAGPVLQQSPRLAQADLLDVARHQSQAHLLAISGRDAIAEPVTDVLIRRGDSGVIRSVAENRRARVSANSFATLVERAEQDGALAEIVGTRPDLPLHLFRELVLKATEVVQQRLFASATPEMQAEIRHVLAKVAHEVGAKVAPRDYSAAERAIERLRQAGKLDETALVDFARTGKYEETVAALACVCRVPIDVVDRLMAGERPDPILILCKSAGWGWATAKAVILARSPGRGASSHGLDNAYSNFERLSSATAARVMRFWQASKPQDR